MSGESKFSRMDVVGRLEASISKRRAILASGCSAGIVAKAAADAGSDLIVVYSTGKTRLMGLPTWRFGDANAITLEMSSEIHNVVSDVPTIAGVEANDPTRLDLHRLVERFRLSGFAGIINFPTLTNMPDLRRRAEQVGLGFHREVELLRIAREQDLFTMSYVSSIEDVVAMADSGVDCLVLHAGPTAGGAKGYQPAQSMDVLVSECNELISAARNASSRDIPILLHGGLLSEPPQVEEALGRTRAAGFVGASSIERIPIERAVAEVVRGFKDLKLS